MSNGDTRRNKKSEVITNLYQNRFKQLRLGQECSQKGNFAKAVEYYSNYLSILAQFHGITESQLTPEFFDQKKDAGELLLISNVYWSLAKTYDNNKQFQHHSQRCLNQFLKFTRGYKHQYANARMLKSYIHSGKPKNAKEFKRVYEKLKIHSPRCFIATHCFGYDDPVTQQLLLLREDISGNVFGDTLIKRYYQYAPSLIHFLEKHSKIKKIALPPLKYLLYLIAQFHQKIT